jgi:hypothetical protein
VATLPQTGAPAAGSVIHDKANSFWFFSATRLVYTADPDNAQPAPFFKLYRHTLGGAAPGELIYGRAREFWPAAGGRLLLKVELGPDQGLWLAAEPS